ncbi:MAG: AGE family epimerase/isomerase [Treponemataceae bacterium]
MSTRFVLPEQPVDEDILGSKAAIHDLVSRGMNTVIARYGKNEGYPWIDTKFSTVDGLDFPAADPERGLDAVFSWIQGRGLEAVAEHYAFIPPDSEAAEKYRALLRGVSRALRLARTEGSGHLYFSMDAAGRPRRPRPKATVSTLSDIFCSRGLYAAARALGDEDAAAEAERYCLETFDAVMRGDYQSDQQAFDPKNPVLPIPGRLSHAPFMLLLPTARLLLRETESGWAERALSCIRHILSLHVVGGETGSDTTRGLRQGDFIEFIDNRGTPFRSDGRILCDPGHALEFVGLAAGFLRTLRFEFPAWEHREESEKIYGTLQNIFRRNFVNGYDEEHGGIVKLYDLESREAVNPDMPWWSLPETMRAAVECLVVSQSEEERAFLRSAYARSWNALTGNYLTEAGKGLCVQTRDGTGKISDAVPAVPDADPCYHTGLSLLACLKLIDQVSILNVTTIRAPGADSNRALPPSSSVNS